MAGNVQTILDTQYGCIIPHCLTPIPTYNRTVGLIGRDEIKGYVKEMMETGSRMVMLYGPRGIGKTEIMKHVCNELEWKEKYIAWIKCGKNLKEDLFALKDIYPLSDIEAPDKVYEEVICEIKENRQLAENLYLFMDDLSYELTEEERNLLKSLNAHIIATSTHEHAHFMNIPIPALSEQAAINMFYGYYLERPYSKTRRFTDDVRYIVAYAHYHTLIIELLAKAAYRKGGTLRDFRNELEKKGMLDVFERTIETHYSKQKPMTIREYIKALLSS